MVTVRRIYLDNTVDRSGNFQPGGTGRVANLKGLAAELIVPIIEALRLFHLVPEIRATCQPHRIANHLGQLTAREIGVHRGNDGAVLIHASGCPAEQFSLQRAWSSAERCIASLSGRK